MTFVDHIRSHVDLAPEMEEVFRSLVKEASFRKGESFSGASLLDYASFIVSGSARVFYTLRGREYTIGFSFPGEFVVPPRFALQAYPDTLTIQFLEPAVVNFLPHVQIKSIFEEKGWSQDTTGLMLLNAALIQYSTFLEERVHVMQSLSARERFQWLLNRYPRILECTTLSNIASYLGVTRETLYRIRAGSYNSRS